MVYETTQVEGLTHELLGYCRDYALTIDEGCARACVEHFLMVIEANKTMNLTRITDEHDGLVLHILDSLLLCPEVDTAPAGALLDIGTGAGYPGIPLALATDRPAVLLDSVGKKVRAVAGFAEELYLDTVTTSSERVEVYAKDNREAFACVVARAVAPLAVLIEYAAPLLERSGSLVVTKGVPAQEEVDAGLKAAQLCGFTFAASRTYELPRGLGTRTLLRFIKTNEPKLGLPRKVGVAKKQPLGY